MVEPVKLTPVEIAIRAVNTSVLFEVTTFS